MPPKSRAPVAYGQHGAGQAPVPQRAQDAGPGLLGLPISVGQGHQFLGAVGAYPDDDQAAQAVFFQADVEMDAVGPPIDVVETRQVPADQSVLGLPGPVRRCTVDADSPAPEPKNSPRAGAKSPVDRPRRYSTGRTSVTLGDLRM